MNNKLDPSILFKNLNETEQEKISGGVIHETIRYPVIVRFAVANIPSPQASSVKRGSKVRIM